MGVAAEAFDAESARYESLRGRRILLVDDNEKLIESWATTLQQVGMHALSATCLRDASGVLRNVSGDRLDFAIIDDKLSDGFGLELLPKLSALQPAPEFVLVTADRSDHRVFATWRAHVALLPKPATIDALLELVLHMDERRAKTLETSGRQSAQPLVLVVEDSVAAVGLIKDTLSGEYRVETARDGYAGFRKAVQLTPDVILTDMIMPGLDGSQLLRLLRSRPDTQHIPVVLLTANADENLRTRLLNEGAQDYLVKPFSAQELKARIGNLAAITRSRALLQSEGSDDKRRLDDIVGAFMLQKKHAVFLSEASKLLGESLEYKSTLKQMMRLFVTNVADAGIVDLVDTTNGQVENVALAHADPTLEFHLSQSRNSTPPVVGEPHTFVRAIQSGIATSFPLEPGLLERLHVQSGFSVPLTARGRMIGALTALSASEARPLGAAEQSLIEDLARRIAISVDHARLYKEATEAVAARDEFLSVASHELKTPLNPLQLQVQMLHRKADEFVVPAERDKIREKLDSIRRQTEKLTRLVNDLLDLSRISGGRIEFEFESVDLTSVVQDVVKLFEEREEIARSRCTLDCQLTPGLIGRYDRFRLEQVVTNLLSNALKYGAGTPVTVVTRVHHGAAELRVRDEGIGIAPQDQARIFERFERAVSARNFGGLGLGLFIVRQLVEGMGGTVRVHSTRRDDKPEATEKRSTVFSVSLPLSHSN